MELTACVQRVLPRRPGTGVRKLEDSRSEHTPDAGLERRLGHGPAVQVHLAGGGHPAAQQLVAAEQHPPAGVVVGQPGLARPDRLAQPALQRQPVPGATQEGHRRVGVGVDQARHHQAAEVHHPVARRRRCIGRPHPGHAVPLTSSTPGRWTDPASSTATTASAR